MPINSTSPRPNDPDVTDARADGSTNFLATGPINFQGVSMDIGSVAKGAVRSVIWMMFEIPLRAGTRFGGMSINLSRSLSSGSGLVPLMVGFIEKDGVWNVGGEAGLGWDEYANEESLPHPADETDALWLDASPSLSHSININDHGNGDIVKWGYNSPALHYESTKFLTDLQTAFDENESDRTSRGVPVAIMMVPPAGASSRIFRFDSAEGTIPPQLFIRTRRIIIV
jgi:hypothetical protein